MSDIKIFICSHKENIRVPKNKLLVPIQVGAAIADYRFPNMLHDDESDNISDKNASYCELTAQYWVWKNVQADYYGFFHYRRYFSFSEEKFPTTHEPFVFDEVVFPDNTEDTLNKIQIEEHDMAQKIESYDFITPCASHSLLDETVYEQYENSIGHHIEDLKKVVNIIEKDYPQFVPAMNKYLYGKDIYCCNMFIMKHDLYDAYCEWLFHILQKHEAITDISGYAPVDRRVSGYLAERLCGVYLTYLYEQGYKGHELQRVYFKDTDLTEYPAIGDETGYLHQLNRKVDIKVKILCRVNGTLYLKIAVQNQEKKYTLFVMGKSTAGYQVLHKKSILNNRGRETEWLLEFPVVQSDLMISLKVLDEERNVCACLNQIITAKNARIHSKMNKLLQKKELIEIYNREHKLVPGEMNVEIDTIIPDLDGTYIIHANIDEMFEKDLYDKFDYGITFTNEANNNILMEPFIILKDKKKEIDRYPEYLIRSLAVSARVSVLPGNLIINVTHGKKMTYCARENWSLQTYILDYQNRIFTASQCQGYDQWFRDNQKVNHQELQFQENHKFEIEPVYSIIVPLYHTPIDFFEDMIQSVLEQSYGKLELILVNASKEDQNLKNAVEQYMRQDERVKVIELEKNMGITENTNAGIDVARGDFICFLDHDDVLEKDVLYEYTHALNLNSQIDLLYCDEDKLMSGSYCDPYFKPDFNLDLLCGINYICHFLTVRKTVVDEIERPICSYDGAQDHNMTLRVAEKARDIAHIAKVLYHWRIHENSTASTPEEKPYTMEAARLCVQHHLERCNISADAINSERVPRHYEIKYRLPEEHPLISIIIPNKDNKKVLERCIQSILDKSTYDNYEIIIVDNDSKSEETFAYYGQLKENDISIDVIPYPKKFNFPEEVNIGVENAKGEYVVLLNNDTEVITPDWLEKMLGPCMRNDIGCVGAKLLFPDRLIQHAGIIMNPDGPMHLNYMLPRYAPGYYDTARLSMDVSAVTGACLMSRKSVYQSVGGFDTTLRIDYNDVDYCLKLREKNLLVLYEAGVELFHYESVTRDGEKVTFGEQKRFFEESAILKQRWAKYYIKGDPYYNKNFASNSVYYPL